MPAATDLSKQLGKLRRDKKVLWFGILLFVLVVLWILLGIFDTTRTSSIPAELRELAKPFVPRLESQVFESIAQQRFFDDEELGAFSIYILDKNNISGSSTIDIMSFEQSSPDEENSGAEQVASEAAETVPSEESSDASVSATQQEETQNSESLLIENEQASPDEAL